MSLTINGATNTLTAASGLAIAGNTAVTGTLSATGTITSTKVGTAMTMSGGAGVSTNSFFEIKGTNASSVLKTHYVGVNAFSTDGSCDVMNINGLGIKVDPTAGVTVNTGLAVTGTLSATGKITSTHINGGGSDTPFLSSHATGTGYGFAVTGQGVDGKNWDVIASSTSLNIRAVNDANSAAGTAIQIIRSAAVITNVDTYIGGTKTLAVSAGSLAVTGTLSASSTTDATTSVFAGNTASLAVAGGLAVVKKGYFGDNIVMASGKGIDFSATANGSGTTTSEVLSDYEEGTWTPTVGGTATYTNQFGAYTKIGNLVTVHCSLIVNLIGTGSAVVVSGLPFTCAATSVYTANAVGYFSGLATSVLSLRAYIDPGNPNGIGFANISAAGVITSIQVGILGNSARVDFSLTYRV